MELDRRAFLGGVAAVAVVPLGLGRRAMAADIPNDGLAIVTDGQPAATVVAPADADDQVMHAIARLVEYVERATGATLPVVSLDLAADPVLPAGVRIVVGAITPSSGVSPEEVAGLGSDGYVLRRAGEQLTIVGGESWGTRYGVYEFLERYLDVRWLMPDDVIPGQRTVGNDVPSTTDVTVGRVDLSDRPAFVNRELNPFPIAGDPEAFDWNWTPGVSWIDGQVTSWGRYARVRHALDFQHNLARVVSPEKYGDPNRPETYHPEFFPIINGETVIPPVGKLTGWQPRFSAPGIADAVADEVATFLRAHPGRTSYSLSVNDGTGFSEDDLEPGPQRYRGFAVASEAYYAFVNRVARLLEPEFPDVRLCVLGYHYVAKPPSFRLHHNVVPFLVADRCGTYRWIRPDMQAWDKEWISQWRPLVRDLAWWDRVYGAAFNLPRMYLGELARTYRYLAEQGVVAVMAEWVPGWGEGPKASVFTSLLWDPHQDVDELTWQWCRAAVGRRAAPYLMAYFRVWDRIWTSRVPKSEWMDHPDFRTADYLEVVTDHDIVTARRMLDRAEDAVATDAQRGRLSVLRQWFEFYAASALSYARHTPAPTSESAALDLLEHGVDTIDTTVALAHGRDLLVDSLGYSQRWRGPQDFSMVWSGWNLYSIWGVAEYIRSAEPVGGAVRDRTIELRNTAGSANQQALAELVLSLADEGTTEVLTNGTFESGEVAPWTFIAPPGVGDTVTVVDEMPLTGAYCMKLPAWFVGQVVQRAPVQPGFYRFSASIRVDSTVPATDLQSHYAKLQARLYDANGAKVRDVITQFSLGPALDRWHHLVQSELIDPGVASADFWVVVDTEHPVYVDDVSVVQQASPTPIEPWFSDTFDDTSTGSAPTTWTATAPGALTVVPAGSNGVLSVRSTQPAMDRIVAMRWFGAADGDVRVSLTIRRAADLRSLDIRLEEPGTRTAVVRLRMINGVFLYSDDDTMVNSHARYTDSEFSDVVLDVQAAAGRYDVIVDGMIVGSGATGVGADAPGKLWIAANGGVALGAESFALDGVAIAPLHEPRNDA